MACWHAMIIEKETGRAYVLAALPATDTATVPPTSIQDRLSYNTCMMIVYPWTGLPWSKYRESVYLGIGCEQPKFPE